MLPTPHSSPNMKHLISLALSAVSIACTPLAAFSQSSWVTQTPTVDQHLGASTYGNDVHVAVGDNGTILSSPDGATWTVEPSGTTEALRDVIFVGGEFVVSGNNGTILTSPDGSNWIARSPGTSAFLSGLAFGVNRYVAVGGSGTIVTSLDAITWSPATSGTGLFLQNVNFAAGLFIATGASGAILSSPDGLAWTVSPSLINLTLTDSGYFGGLYLAIGQSGTLLSSPDGTSWSFENSGTLNLLRSITDNGISCIMCGDNGTILTSGDGISWSPVSSGTTTTLRGVRFAGGKFISVGELSGPQAIILVSERDPGFSWGSSEVSVGEADGSVMLLIERSGSTAATASVDFQTVDGSAIGGDDFTSTSSTANFAIGQSAVNVAIPISNNPDGEAEETFSVELSSPSPASLILYPPSAATVRIIDAQDSDFDGLPDDWEILHFGDLSSNGPGDDPDFDGNDNSIELADGTDPDDGSSASYRLSYGVAAGIGTVSVAPDLATYPTGTSITLTPAGGGEFDFITWQGDASGASDPLVITITSDLDIDAVFEVSLTDALDEDCLTFTLSGTGQPWFGQGVVTSDGADAAETGNLSSGQSSIIEASVDGPAELTFQWKVSTSQFDSFRFFIDGSPRASSSGESDWKRETLFIGSGTHTIKWTYSKNSTFSVGSNQAWLDHVRLSYSYEHWLRAYFNPTEQANLLVSGSDADPDMDGTNNLLEFLFDLHPKRPDADSPNLPRVTIVESGGQKFGALIWTQHQKRAETLDLSVEFSTHLEAGSWQTLSAPVEEISTASPLRTLRVINPAPHSSPVREFYRLTAGTPP